MFGKNKEETKTKGYSFKLNLGDRVRDTITGFEGIITSRIQWLHNCNTYAVQPTVLKDGKPQEREHFDEPQLELVTERVAYESPTKTGGPERPVFATNR